MSGTYPVPTPSTEVFGNCSSCVAAAGSGGSNGTSNPTALTNETWTMSTGSTSFPVAQQTTFPYNYFFIRDPADTTNEICMVILGGSNTTTWSVIRGINGATVAHASGATWVQVIAPYSLQNFKQAPSASITPVTITTSTTETVLANYLPVATDLVPGATWEMVAFGPITAHGGTTRGTLGFNVYWGGSGAPGSAFTSTGSTRIASLVAGSNMPAFAATTVIAGASFDVNGTVTILTTSGGVAATVTANLNAFYQGGAALTTAQSTATCNNVTSSGGASSGTAVSVATGAGPIILTAVWTANYTVYGLTATAPLIYRAA